MKRFWLAAAAALILTAMLPDGAFAQRGGFRGGGFGGGGFRGAAIGGGFQGAAIGGGFRGAAISPGFRSAAIGPGFRTAAFAPGFRRRGFGFGYPFVAGVGLGLAATYPYYSAYYSDPCVVLDPYYGWVNVCPYSPYYY
jgi:hypothetical protein